MNIEKHLIKKTTEAIRRYSLLDKDEKIIFALSGGKDSKSLLKILSKIHPRENIFPVHVFPYKDPHLSKDMEDFCDILLDRPDSLSQVENTSWKEDPEACYLCARARKKLLFEKACSMGIRKVVYAHNKNDVAETFLMNILFSGNSWTMQPKQTFFDQEICVIRPFYLLEVRHIIRYCEIYHILPLAYDCKGKALNKRETVRNIMDSLENSRHGLRSDSVVHRVFKSSCGANHLL